MVRVLVKVAAGVAGILLLAATANLTIVKTTGYEDAHALLVLAIAGGVGIGAWTLGHSWRDGRKPLAVVTGALMICGELFGLSQTADRIAAQRDRAQQPVLRQIEAHEKAATYVGDTQTKLEAVPTSSSRLEAALAKKAAADNAVVAKSAERNCATNCRALLEQQVVLAQNEIDAARAELGVKLQQAEQELAAARKALIETPKPEMSATPLANNLNITPATLDMIIASLGALGANGLAACLIAFAAHGRHYVVGNRPDEETPAKPRSQRKNVTRDEADHFARSVFRPDPNGRVYLRDVRAAYRAWCAETKRRPLPDQEIGAALNALFSSVGLYRESSGADAAIVGVAWKKPLQITNSPLKLIGLAPKRERIGEEHHA